MPSYPCASVVIDKSEIALGERKCNEQYEAKMSHPQTNNLPNEPDIYAHELLPKVLVSKLTKKDLPVHRSMSPRHPPPMTRFTTTPSTRSINAVEIMFVSTLRRS